MARLEAIVCAVVGLVVPVLAGGCGGSALGDTTVVNGQIQGWTEGAGYQLKVGIAAGVLVSGTIDSAGNFSVTLPGAATVTPNLTQITSTLTLGPGCTGAVTVTPLTALAGAANFDAVMGTSSIGIGLMSGMFPMTGPYDVTAGSYYYAEQATTVIGSQTCTGGTASQTSYNESFNQGWNIQLVHVTMAAGGTVSSSYTTGALPATVTWEQNSH